MNLRIQSPPDPEAMVRHRATESQLKNLFQGGLVNSGNTVNPPNLQNAFKTKVKELIQRPEYQWQAARVKTNKTAQTYTLRMINLGKVKLNQDFFAQVEGLEEKILVKAPNKVDDDDEFILPIPMELTHGKEEIVMTFMDKAGKSFSNFVWRIPSNR